MRSAPRRCSSRGGAPGRRLLVEQEGAGVVFRNAGAVRGQHSEVDAAARLAGFTGLQEVAGGSGGIGGDAHPFAVHRTQLKADRGIPLPAGLLQAVHGASGLLGIRGAEGERVAAGEGVLLLLGWHLPRAPIPSPQSDGTSLRDNVDLHDEEGIRWDDARNTGFSVCQVRGNANPPRATNAHSFDSIEEAREHVLAVDSQRREQRGAVVLESSSIVQTPWLAPSNWIAATEPHPEAKIVEDLLLDRSPEARNIFEQLHPRLHGASNLVLDCIRHLEISKPGAFLRPGDIVSYLTRPHASSYPPSQARW